MDIVRIGKKSATSFQALVAWALWLGAPISLPLARDLIVSIGRLYGAAYGASHAIIAAVRAPDLTLEMSQLLTFSYRFEKSTAARP
jgi:hypothetical protein